MLAEGASAPAVLARLGDTVQTVQEVYAHWLRDEEDAMAEPLARVFATDAFPDVAASRSVTTV